MLEYTNAWILLEYYRYTNAWIRPIRLLVCYHQRSSCLVNMMGVDASRRSSSVNAAGSGGASPSQSIDAAVCVHKEPFERYPDPVLGAVTLFLSTFGENCPHFQNSTLCQVSKGPGWCSGRASPVHSRDAAACVQVSGSEVYTYIHICILIYIYIYIHI